MERTMPLAGQRAAAGEAAALPQWSNALRAIREARGVSQAGWAARLGRSRNTVQRWESGAAVPDQEAEQAIIDYCRGQALFDLPLYDGALSADGLRRLFAVARLGGVATRLPPAGRSLDAVLAAGPAQPMRASLPESGEPAAARGARRPLLVGRETELAVLRERLAAAQAGHGSLVLLVGEPGIGKTRLAEALAAEAQGAGVSVLWGRCWEGDGAPPFWPWRELLRGYSEQQCPRTLRAKLGSGAAALTQLLP
jgi:transcriptional regulator with XRE-family HTH domain